MGMNEIFRDADHLSLPVPDGTTAGDPVRVGDLNGVCQTDRANTAVAPYLADDTPNPAYNAGGGNPDGHATVWLKGRHDFEVDFAVAGVGVPVYIVTPTNVLTAVSVGNQLYGHSLSTKSAAVGPLTVRITNRPGA